ncbi:metal-dependent hydrolase [Candidatus Woesearchaeota archaeon]|nr:metal-dependent hydrolase [Candidatus Woesearchaeota archaeon]
MLARTHLAFALLLGVFIFPGLNFNSLIEYTTFYLLLAFAVFLPDIDHPNSKINTKLPFLKIASLFFSHRGFLHSIFAPILIGGIAYINAGLLFALPIFLGYFAHLLADAITINGIAPFYPIIKFKFKGPVRTGHNLEFFLFYITIGLTVFRIYFLIF